MTNKYLPQQYLPIVKKLKTRETNINLTWLFNCLEHHSYVLLHIFIKYYVFLKLSILLPSNTSKQANPGQKQNFTNKNTLQYLMYPQWTFVTLSLPRKQTFLYKILNSLSFYIESELQKYIAILYYIQTLNSH